MQSILILVTAERNTDTDWTPAIFVLVALKRKVTLTRREELHTTVKPIADAE